MKIALYIAAPWMLYLLHGYEVCCIRQHIVRLAALLCLFIIMIFIAVRIHKQEKILQQQPKNDTQIAPWREAITGACLTAILFAGLALATGAILLTVILFQENVQVLFEYSELSLSLNRIRIYHDGRAETALAISRRALAIGIGMVVAGGARFVNNKQLLETNNKET